MVKIWKVSSHLEEEPEIEAAREEKKKDANTKSMDEALLQLWRSARGWGEGWYGTRAHWREGYRNPCWAPMGRQVHGQ